MINGLNIKSDVNSIVMCIVEDFSDELKEFIRKDLTSICYGSNKINRNPKLYSYKKTLEEFLERFNSKSYKTQVGMIGELLTHVILLRYHSNLNSINPFFNLEEKSIKKGFDLVLIQKDCGNKLWITEVKSGRIGNFNCTNDKNLDLLNIAKNDLKIRLNEDDNHIWHNAINGAMVAMQSNNLKEEVIKILENSLEDSMDKNSTSNNKNVILTSVLFNDITDSINYNSICECHKKFSRDGIFNDLMLLSIQKNTFEKIVEFLKEEVNK